MTWRSYVALGDSFTEGMDDPYPDGRTFRGWADLVAARLALDAGPGFGYANLAIRGRLLDQVIAEQVEPALAMRPDLVSFAAGGNDVLRRKVDPAGLIAKVDGVVERFRAAGADVVIFRFADISQLPGQRLVGARAAQLNDGITRIGANHGAHVIDLHSDDAFRNSLMWSTDRLHMSPAGHRRVAAHVLTSLGVGVDEDWMLVPPAPAPTPWLLARRADIRWAGQHLAPWIKRRLTGVSSGDGITAKRPSLSPIKE
jgi:lysophospholipase L1-like esterase